MDKEFKMLSLHEGYPELENPEKNDYYVGVLQNLYASCGGEVNAIMLYSYQVNYFKKDLEYIARAVEEIAMDEMVHMRLLAEAILFYGGDPKYNTRIGMPYTTRCVKYENEYVPMLVVDVNSEKDAIEAYTKAILIVRSPSLKALLKRIRRDEREHLSIFEEFLAEIRGEPTPLFNMNQDDMDDYPENKYFDDKYVDTNCVNDRNTCNNMDERYMDNKYMNGNCIDGRTSQKKMNCHDNKGMGCHPKMK